MCGLAKGLPPGEHGQGKLPSKAAVVTRRLRGHARRFHSHPDQETVLGRYVAKGAENPERYAVHVAAWLAFAPQGQCPQAREGPPAPKRRRKAAAGGGEAAEAGGAEPPPPPPPPPDPSGPAELLVRLLRTIRRRGPFRPKLHAALQRVVQRCSECSCSGHSTLARALPRWLPKPRPTGPGRGEAAEKKGPAAADAGRAAPAETEGDRGQLALEEGAAEEAGAGRPPRGAKAEGPLELAPLPGKPVDAAASEEPSELQLADRFQGLQCSQKAIRRFHKAVARFQNEGLEGRRAQVDELARAVQAAIDAEAWDELCVQLQKAIAALSGPRARAVPGDDREAMPEDARERLQEALQSRLRKLLVKGLNCLDLEDVGTWLRLQPATARLGCVIRDFEAVGCSPVLHARAGQQWSQLQTLLHGSGSNVQSKLPATVGDAGASGRGGTRHHKSRLDGDLYEPYVSIQSLPMVHKMDAFHHLRCDRCHKDLWTQWVFVRGGKQSILRPQHRHKCGGRFVSVDGLHCIADTRSILDFCSHGYQRKDCYVCGGDNICQHRRRRRRCRVCRQLGLVQVRSRSGAGPGAHEAAVSGEQAKSVYRRSRFDGGVYEPASVIRSLAAVRKTDIAYRLRCSRCSKELLSQWVFAHGGTLGILRPQHGHRHGCGGKFESVDGLHCKSDKFANLDLCGHNKMRKDCCLCGGRATCKHQKIRRLCRTCRESGLVRIRPRKAEQRPQ